MAKIGFDTAKNGLSNIRVINQLPNPDLGPPTPHSGSKKHPWVAAMREGGGAVSVLCTTRDFQRVATSRANHLLFRRVSRERSTGDERIYVLLDAHPWI